MRHVFRFPDPRDADAEGLVALTETVTAPLLVAAYSQGIFPWTRDPVGWFSPDPRAIFPGAQVALPSNTGRLFRRAGLTVTCDTAFVPTMRACRRAHRDRGAWIDTRWLPAFLELHEAGLAHSVEVWRGDALVGGIYGVNIAGLFAGESMFHLEANASKFALGVLAAQLAALGVGLFDVQVLNPHTERLGAVNVERTAYLRLLEAALRRPLPAARWKAAPLAWGALST